MSYSRDVFICYTRKDQYIAKYCKRILQSINVSTFIDTDSIVAGSDFAESIQRELVNCSIILFIISEHTKHSLWALKEISFAKRIGKTIIPILVEDTILDNRLLYLIEDIDYIEWKQNETSLFDERLIRTVNYYFDKFRADTDIPIPREIDIEKEIKILDEYQPQTIDFDIFISYRRVGGRDIARSIKYRLEMMGFNKIFFDYNSIRDGMFNTQIMDAIYSCNDFLLLLTPNSMDRCAERGDWVTREIRTAKKYGKKIIPISVESDFKWPTTIPSDLYDIRFIKLHNLLVNEDFDYSIENLSRRFKSSPNATYDHHPVLYYKIRTNKDCRLFIDGNDYCMLKSGVLKKIALNNSGEYLIELYHLDLSEKLYQKIISLEQDKVDIVDL